MKKLSWAMICAGTMLCITALSQTTARTTSRTTSKTTEKTKTPDNKITRASKKVDDANAAVNSATSSAETTIQSANNLKTKLSALLGKKNSGAILIAVDSIEFEDVHLTALKEKLKDMKGVKKMDAAFKNNAVTLEIFYKGNAGELWERLPGDIKIFFKVLQIEDKGILLRKNNPAAKDK